MHSPRSKPQLGELRARPQQSRKLLHPPPPRLRLLQLPQLIPRLANRLRERPPCVLPWIDNKVHPLLSLRQLLVTAPTSNDLRHENLIKRRQILDMNMIPLLRSIPDIYS